MGVTVDKQRLDPYEPYTPDSVQQRVWVAIRIFRPTFDVNSICMATEVKPAQFYTYIAKLKQAGYVKKVHVPRGKRIAGINSQYRLIRNTGPFAPLAINKTNQMYDLNTKEFFDLAPKGSTKKEQTA